MKNQFEALIEELRKEHVLRMKGKWRYVISLLDCLVRSSKDSEEFYPQRK